MRKQFNMILDFQKLNSESVKAYYGESIVVNALMRLDEKPINLANPNYHVKVRICSKYGGCQIYSGSLIEIINPDKGLIKCSLPKRALIPNLYEALFEIYDAEDENTLYSGDIKIEILENADHPVECFTNHRNIETLKELDEYVRNAMETLRELEARLYE